MASNISKTPAKHVWSCLTPEQRLSHLSTLPQLTGGTTSRILRDVLETAKASIPFLRSSDVHTAPGVTVTKTYHPVSKVAIITQSSNPETSLVYAVTPLLAGSSVALRTTQNILQRLPPSLRDAITLAEDDHVAFEGADIVLYVGSRRKGLEIREVVAKGTQFCDYGSCKVALVLHDTTTVSRAVEAISSVHECEELRISVYACQGMCDQLKKQLQSRDTGPGSWEGMYGLSDGLCGAVSVYEIATLEEAVATINNGDYDIVAIFGDAAAITAAAKEMKASCTGMNTLPNAIPLLAQGPESIRQFLKPRSLLVREEGQLAILKQYFVGRFDNSAQIAAEKAAGGQRTASALHINGLIDDKIEGGPHEGVFHILEETYKYTPGERNPRVVPLLLRFEDVDGRVAVTSLQIPEGLDLASIRNDNPALWFGMDELKVGKRFPERQLYTYDAKRMEFSLDVQVTTGPERKFRLRETIARDRLTVSEKVWVKSKLQDGFYEEPYLYDRVHSRS